MQFLASTAQRLLSPHTYYPRHLALPPETDLDRTTLHQKTARCPQMKMVLGAHNVPRPLRPCFAEL